jgi:hypothetical protein
MSNSSWIWTPLPWLWSTPPPPPPPPDKDVYNALLDGASKSLNSSDSWFLTSYPIAVANSLRSAFGTFTPQFWFDIVLGIIFAICFLRLLWRSLRGASRIACALWSLTGDAPTALVTFLLTIVTGVLALYILLQSRAQFPERHDTIVQTLTIAVVLVGDYFARMGGFLLRLVGMG